MPGGMEECGLARARNPLHQRDAAAASGDMMQCGSLFTVQHKTSLGFASRFGRFDKILLYLMVFLLASADGSIEQGCFESQHFFGRETEPSFLVAEPDQVGMLQCLFLEAGGFGRVNAALRLQGYLSLQVTIREGALLPRKFGEHKTEIQRLGRRTLGP